MTASAEDVPSYSLTKAQDAEAHGTIAFKVGENTVTTAKEGETVTIVVTPAEGWATGKASGKWYAAEANAPRRADIDMLQDFEPTKLLGSDDAFSFVMERANAEIGMTYKKLMTNTDITIADIADQICTGSEIKPAVSIKDGETDLTEGVDYDLAYSNNINVGTATVTITGKDGYAGTGTKEFVILRQMKDLFADGNQWTGYVAEEDLDLPAGLTAYVITALGEESATASALSYIPQGVPVLLSREDKGANLYLASAGTGTAPTTNLLKVAGTTVQPVAYQDYALYKDAFILYGGGTLASGKVFLALPQSSKSRSATRSIVIDGDDTTGMSEALSVESEESAGDWYDLQGRRLEGRPLKRGLYIHNGQKTVIK